MKKCTLFQQASLLIFTVFILVLSACNPLAPGSDSTTPTNPVIAEKEEALTPTSSEPATPLATDLPTETMPATEAPTATPSIQTLEPTTELSTPNASAEMTSEQPPTIAGLVLHEVNERGGLQVVAGTSLYWTRPNALPWGRVEPREGERNWTVLSGFEDGLINASENGLEVIVMVASAPFFAQARPGWACGPIKQESLDAFGDFMYDVVDRYSQPPYSVRYWEFGNEPDVDPSLVRGDSPFGCMGDKSDTLYYGGGDYADLLRAVYPRIKDADPDAQVIVGGLLMDCDPVNPPLLNGTERDCTSSRFLEGILVNGGGDYFDGVSFHAYDYYFDRPGHYGNGNWHSKANETGPVVIAKTQYLWSLLEEYGAQNKFLVNTENAVICGPPMNCASEDYEDTKAYYAAQSNAAALAEGLLANVWYSIFGWRGSGAVNSTLQPKPVLAALDFSGKELGGALFLRKLEEFPGVMGYEFDKDGERLWVIWSLDQEPHTIPIPGGETRVFDVFGEHISVGDALEITVSPLYIHFQP